MSADLTPYPAMKDSGVAWLGAVPQHWEVRKLVSRTLRKRWLRETARTCLCVCTCDETGRSAS